MSPKLRRAHRAIWLVQPIVLVVVFAAALRLNRIPPALKQPVGAPVAAPLPVLVKSVEKPGFRINLRQGCNPTGCQLEIVVRQPLEVPSMVVRVGHPFNGLAVGTLHARGVYRFALPDPVAHPTISLVDEVHHITLETIHF